jgi:hypothetical protein
MKIQIRTLEQYLTKIEGKILLHPVSKYCGAYKNILWIRLLTRSSSNDGIMTGPCPSVCPHVPPLILLREFQIKLVLWHRDVFPSVKRDIRNCSQFASGALLASCPVGFDLSLYDRKRLESEADQAFPCTVAPWLGMEEYHFI